MLQRFLLVTAAWLTLCVSAVFCFPSDADYDVIDLDASPILDGSTLRLSLNSGRHQVNVDLEEREFTDVPTFFINRRGEMEPYRFEESGKTSQLLKGKDTRASFILSTESDGSSQLYGFAAGADGHTVIRPAPVHVRQARDAGNWHVVYRRQTAMMPDASDALYPGDEKYQQEWKQNMSKPLPPKSRSGTLAVKWVQVLPVTDFELFERFSKWVGSSDQAKVVEFMKLYISMLMGEIDDKYQASFRNDPDMRINIRLAGFIVATEAGKSPFVEGADVQIAATGTTTYGRKTFHGINGLNAFRSWMLALNSPIEYDMGLHLTGRDIRTDGGIDGAAGFANVGGVCTQWRFGNSEVFGSWEEVHYAAHEIGHNLGSNHDADPSNVDSAKCTADDNYIMTTTYPTVNLLNHFVLSPCSKVQIKKNLALPGHECVNNNAAHVAFTADKLAKYLPGMLFSYTELCKNRNGPAAAPYNYEHLVQFKADICTGLYCFTNTPEWSPTGLNDLLAPEGTPCGDGKWCMEAACVANASAPKGECFLGDTVYDVFDFSLGKWQILQCPDAVAYLTKNGYTTVADMCSRNAKFKKNCCRMCGVAGGIYTASRDAIFTSTASTTVAPTTTTKTSTTTTATTKAPISTAVPCQAGQTCKYQLPASRCNEDFMIPNVGIVSVSCKASCT